MATPTHIAILRIVLSMLVMAGGALFGQGLATWNPWYVVCGIATTVSAFLVGCQVFPCNPCQPPGPPKSE